MKKIGSSQNGCIQSRLGVNRGALYWRRRNQEGCALVCSDVNSDASCQSSSNQEGCAKTRFLSHMKTLSLVGVCAVVLIAMLCLGACSSKTTAPTPEEGAHLTIASLKGPTSIGLASLMQQGDDSLYSFEIQGTADAIVALVASGNADIALVPANVAALLYKKTNSGVQVVDINTLGVLYGVSQSDAFTSIEDLRGSVVYMTGKGAVPEYTLRALLSAAGISADEVTIEFKSEPTEVVAAISANPQALGILPQPYVVAATEKNDALNVCLDLTQLWDNSMGKDAGKLITGVTIVRTEVLEQYPKAVARFVSDHNESVQNVLSDPAKAASAVVEAGIVASEDIATKAIPACNIVCITGQEMKSALQGYLQVLADQNAASVGGSVPDDNFYWLG